MAIDVNDHRRYAAGKLAESLKKAEDKLLSPLLEQVESTAANTGDAHLDKLARSVQELLNKAEENAKATALKGIGCVQEDLFRLQQFEYFYLQGQVEAYKQTLLIPQRILAEDKPLIS